MKTILVLSGKRLAALLVLLCLSQFARGAIVNPLGYTNAFGLQPPAADWATLSIAGSGTDTYAPDALVNTSITAGGVVMQPMSDAGNPPMANANAVWSSTGLYLQTRPTGNRATVLMGKFLNNTGSNATQVTVSYTLTIASGGAAEDMGYGSRVYFSVTGAANSWTNVLNITASANASIPTSIILPLNWTNGGSLFLLWLDDNSLDGTDSANQIDNFSLRVTGGTPTNFFCSVTGPTNYAAFPSGTTISAAALAVNGTAPYHMEYFLSSGAGNTTFSSVGASDLAPYPLSLGTLPVGTHQIYAAVTDSAGSPRTTNSFTNTFFVADPISFALTAPANGSMVDHTTPVIGATTVSGGTPPYSVQFFLNGVPDGVPVLAEPYEHNFGPLVVGDYAIQARVQDANGWISNSLVSNIRITGPLAATLSPGQGTVLSYSTPNTLRATVAGGSGPYTATFYVNGQLFASMTAPPFVTNLAVTTAGSYTCYVHATDASFPQQSAYSRTNIFVLPPQLRIMPVGDSITYGLGAPGGYRAPLYRMLTNAGHAVDFLGTQTGNTAPELPDPHHEGYGGWTISQIDGRILTSFSMVADPDVILLMIGINDYRGGVDLANATNRLEALVAKMATARPDARIIVASLTPVSEPMDTQVQTSFNAFLPGICERQRALGRRVYFTDMHSAVPLSDMPDQLHPNQTGYEKMAAQWFGAIESLPCTNCPPRFAVQPMSQYIWPGSNVLLRAEAVSLAGPVQYQWRFEGADIPNATNAAYTINNASAAHQGTYSVTASNSIGSAVSSNANLVFNSPPAVSPIPDQETPRNVSLPVNFTVGDAETAADLLVISAGSSNTNLVNAAGLMLSGTGNARTLTLVPRPNQLGTSTIYVFVNDGVFSTGVSFQFRVTGTNSPPSFIQMLSPVNASVYAAPATIPLSVSVSDPDGNIARVDYLLGNSVIASAGPPSFNALWANVPPGDYQLRALATDEGGLSVTSVLRRVIVENSVTLVPAGSVWRFYDVKGVDLGTAWRETNYVDSAWASGPAKLGFGDPATTTVNSDTTRVTTYFRHRFVVTNLASITNLVCALIRDDGGVVYLNGTEIFRSGMPAGAVNYLTLASSAISGAEETTWFTNRTISPTFLRTGTNVVAVEIHQGSNDSSDLGFDFSLAAQTNVGGSTPIPLSISRTSTQLMLDWPGDTSWNLYYRTALGGSSTWNRVLTPGQYANGHTTVFLPQSNSNLFFRLSRP